MVLPQREAEHGITDGADQADYAGCPNGAACARLRSSEPGDFGEDLLPPGLPQRMGTLIQHIRFCSVIMNAVEDPDVSKFFVKRG